MSDTIYYVYAWVREDGSPYYIGKGKGDRAYQKKRKFIPPKERIVILESSLTEEEAFEIERHYISEYGRKDLGTGILRNKTDGGEGISGFSHSEDTKRRISQKVSEQRTGMTFSDEHKKALSKSHKGLAKGQVPWNKGTKGVSTGGTPRGSKFSEEHKKALSESHKGKPANNKGCFWINNGEINKMVKGDIPEGWVKGILKK